MNDYIRREAAYEEIMGQYPDAHYPGWYGEIVKRIPTADVRPVVHGRWVHHAGGYSDHYDCTACGKDFVKTGKWNHCPNCGADMREKGAENDG